MNSKREITIEPIAVAIVHTITLHSTIYSTFHLELMAEEDIDFHPIELTAHSLLSGSLDNLHENFVLLHQSQHILLTRLRLIEDRLKEIHTELAVSGKDVTQVQARIRAVRKKLADVAKILVKVDRRVGQLEK